jgi:hypothetical protein
MSLASLALSFRHTFAQQRRLSTLSAVWKSIRSDGPLVPYRSWPLLFAARRRWLFTNQMSVGMASLSVPVSEKNGEATLPLLAFYFLHPLPIELDHVVSIQKVEGGVTVTGTMRRGEWEEVEKAVKDLEGGAKATEL